MKKLRTILAVALVLCLMAGLMPMAAFADDAGFDEIAAGQIPLSSDASWALVNLIACLLTALLTIVCLVNRREKEDGSDERETCIRISLLLPTVASVTIFVLTENVRNLMAMVDAWTPVMLVILVANCVLCLSASRKSGRKKSRI